MKKIRMRVMFVKKKKKTAFQHGGGSIKVWCFIVLHWKQEECHRYENKKNSKINNVIQF